jgi:outer membrane protein assembly factor BamE (lipoprotein component of BamABCDE complex)
LSGPRLRAVLISVALALGLLFLLLPSRPLSVQQIRELHLGLTPVQVRELLGSPNSTTTYSGTIHNQSVSTEIWHYTFQNRPLVLTFEDGVLVNEHPEGI